MWSPSRPSGEDSSSSEEAFYALPSPQPTRPLPMQRPWCLVTFSYDSSRVLGFNNSAMKYFKQPPYGASLQRGYEDWIKRPETRPRLDGLLQAINRAEVKKFAQRADFITWRGILTKIIVFPYENRESFDLNIMIVDDVMYMEEHVTAKQLEQKENIEPYHRLLTYFGYSFEEYCTSSSPTPAVKYEEAEHIIDTNIQWCAVVRSKLDNLRFIVGGEVDCVQEAFTGHTDTFLELKTSQVMRNPRDEVNFTKKLLKFWAQSFVLGVPRIVVGFRTQQGIIDDTQTFNTLEIPSLVKGREGAWDAGFCLHFAARSLAYIKAHVLAAQKDGTDERSVWRARFNAKSGVLIRKLDPDEVLDVENGEDRIGFLPRDFLQSQ